MKPRVRRFFSKMFEDFLQNKPFDRIHVKIHNGYCVVETVLNVGYWRYLIYTYYIIIYMICYRFIL